MASIWLREDIEVSRPVELVTWYWRSVSRGPTYYSRSDAASGDADVLDFGDLSWAVLLEGRPSSAAAQSLLENSPISISRIPSDRPLAQLTDPECAAIIDTITDLVRLPGFACSIATKVLHPKRRQCVPVLDNRAIFGTFMSRGWKIGGPVRGGSVRGRDSISEALDSVRRRLVDERSADGWKELLRDAHAGYNTGLTQVEVFDMCWWAVVRNDEGVLAKAGVTQR